MSNSTGLINISEKYPEKQYNLLGNVSVVTKVPDIKSPVIQVIRIDTDPSHGEVYLQQKGYRDNKGIAHPDLYAITKNGLKKLADGAGITMVSSEHVLPTTCQKCIAAAKALGRPVNCGTCSNKDLAFKVTISVPQLTGDNLLVEDTNEIIFANLQFASANQKTEFTKFAPQICEAKALNGAIRTALHLKGAYTIADLQKPFVAAYLVPNLDNGDVKKRAIDAMFAAQSNLFASAPQTVARVETKAPDTPEIAVSDEDQAVIDTYVDGILADSPESVEPTPDPAFDEQMNYAESAPAQNTQAVEEQYQCSNCGRVINRSVYDYSMNHFNKPLCYNCQQNERQKGRR